MEQERLFFSIIVPTFNRPAQLATCLESLACLDYPPDRFEVIVVDDGSPAHLKNLVASFSNRLNILLAHQPNSGPAKARNTGAKMAKGEFLAFTDDDCIPSADWLQALENRFRDNRDVMIGGKTLNGVPDNLYSLATHLMVEYLYQHYNAAPNDAHFFSTNNMAMPANLFRTSDGFDTTFPLAAGEDRDFCDRWLQQGKLMIYAPEVLIRHAQTLGPRTFCRQHFNYGRGAYRYHQARAGRNTGHFRPNPGFYIQLLCYPFIQKLGRRSSWLAILLMVSQIANAIGFFWERLNHHQRNVTGG